MLFINTRPAERAPALTAALQSAGCEVLELPLLQLQALPLDSALQAQFAQLPTAHVLVVVSPMAVEVGMRYLQQLGICAAELQHLTWIAVGVGTAQCLQAYGIHSQVPEIENSEGMLEIAALKTLAPAAKIAFWRGVGGRQFMMQQLTEAGHSISNMLLYTRSCPEQSTTQFALAIKAMQTAQPLLILITSEASWLNWLKLLAGNIQLLQHGQYWVLGERLEQLLQHYAQQQQYDLNIRRIDDLKTDYVLDQLRLSKGIL